MAFSKRKNIQAIERELNDALDTDRFPDWDFNRINETFRVAEEIFKTLTPEAVLELTGSADTKGLNEVFDTVLEETYGVLYGKHIPERTRINSESFGYLDKLTNSMEETLRCENLTYFITSVLPEFELDWFALEWSEIVQLYKKAAIIASRYAGKSYFFSNAVPAWRLYRYKGKLGKTVADQNPRGFLFSFSIQQAIDLLEILSNTIEESDILRERLYDRNRFSKTEIRCLNKARLTVKGFGSSVRGAHPGWIVIDDALKDNVLFSKLQREKSTNYLHSVIMNMPVRDGSVHIVGCVDKNTWITTENGLEQIIKLAPQNKNLYKKGLKDCDIKLYGVNNKLNKATKFYSNGLTNTIKIKTFTDYELECSQIHPLMKMDEYGYFNWCKSTELKLNDWILIKKKIENIGKPIQLKGKFDYVSKAPWSSNTCNLPDFVNEDLAYLIGLYTAEGSVDKKGEFGFGISATEKDITDFLKSSPFGLKFNFRPQNNNWRCGNKKFVQLLKWLGSPLKNASQKEVPYKFMQGEKKIVAAFLSGFFDGDGSSSDKNGELSCGSISKKLIYQIKLLLIHYFGIDSSITKSQPGISKIAKGKFPIYQCKLLKSESLSIFYKEIGFRLKRKQINNKFVIKRNGRIDLPWVSKLILKLWYDNVRPKKPFYKVRDSIAIDYRIVRQVLEHYGSICPEHEAYVQLKRIYDLTVNQGYKWEKIVELGIGKSFTFDFVVPNTNSFISNGIVSHNTPFHTNDMYGDLKTKKGWVVFEYPGIFPDGRLLCKSRLPFGDLMQKKEDQGNLIFSREILCRPISADSTIFPPAILNTAFFGMDDFTLVNNRESYKKKFKTVVIGCDFAISGSVGADYTVYLVFGIDDLDRMWLMQVYRARGASYVEQTTMLKRLNTEFRPEIIVGEDNGFQQIFVQESERAGLPIVGETTTAKKNDLKEGLPSLAVLFERGKFKVPTGDQRSKDFADEAVLEFSSVAFTDEKGLCATGGHDDICLAWYKAVQAARKLTTGELGFNFDFA